MVPFTRFCVFSLFFSHENQRSGAPAPSNIDGLFLFEAKNFSLSLAFRVFEAIREFEKGVGLPG